MGIREFVGMGYCVNDMQTMQTIESQLMMSHGSCTKQSQKSIAQTNHTNELHKTIAQNKMTSCPRMCMEDLRLVNLTEMSKLKG